MEHNKRWTTGKGYIGAPNSINDRVERKKKDLVLSKKREFC